MNLIDFNIQKFIDIDYVTDNRKSRRKGSSGTQEFFTPFSIDWKTALETCYVVELMQDNVYETHARIIKLFDELGIDYDEDVAMDIMLRNLVCHDFFTWNFEEWRPMTDEEIKQSKKK